MPLESLSLRQNFCASVRSCQDRLAVSIEAGAMSAKSNPGFPTAPRSGSVRGRIALWRCSIRRRSMAITPTRVLRYETRDRKAYITLNRPEVMNALNFEIGNAIAEAVREFGNDNNLLVAIISGEGGRAFSAGMDLKETTQRDQGALPADRARVSGARAAFDELTNCRKPVIAAI